MVALDDPRWADLRDAYGSAVKIPSLLRQLRVFPVATDYRSEPYFSLWSALCHQGDVYTASYAAVPHIVEALLARSGQAPDSPVQLVVCIEIARAKGAGPAVPADLEGEYREAIRRIVDIAHGLTRRPCSEATCRVAAAALAVANGYVKLADVILELDPDILDDFTRWVEER